MPRENRKRGKKHKRPKEESFGYQSKPEPEAGYEDEPEQQAGPSWIVQKQTEEVNREAPFGYVDAEVKAYFRTVDLQIREWQEQGNVHTGDGNEDVDPNEDRRLFFVAALTEMEGKEKQLATDPDCSTVMERMIHSMDDFVRRVFMDRLSGSFEQLANHRFASHVCQTLFDVASETVYRESRGILPSPSEDSADRGELRTLTQLVVDASNELLPSLSSLVMDPFASHVVRALLLLLAPECFPPRIREHAVRSKKSAAWKARQGLMKSVFSDPQAGAPENGQAVQKAQPVFGKMARRIVGAVREQLGENEVRALAADKTASPVLQMLLEIEAEYGMAEELGSLMDRALVGMITSMCKDPSAPYESSDYLNTLLRDPIASHVLETVVRRSPLAIFPVLWSTYFEGKLARLAVHPVANFVVQKSIGRVGKDELRGACGELEGEVPGKIPKAGRLGVLQALVERAVDLHAYEQEVVQVLHATFGLTLPDDSSLVVPCILRALAVGDYKTALTAHEKTEEQEGGRPRKQARHGAEKGDDAMEPKVQGALLLQSLLRLSSPHNELVLDSIQAMSQDDLIEMAHHPMSSHVLDVALESPMVPAKFKRRIVLGFLGRFHELVDDRIGSRVGERCWAAADGYMKEKIARSLMPHEHFLSGSFYGKFFARVLNLQLFKRDPERWKDAQASAGASTTGGHTLTAHGSVKSKPTPLQAAPATPVGPSDEVFEPTASGEKRKRKWKEEDEIDALFESTLGKVKKAGLGEGNKQRSAGQHREKKSGIVKEDHQGIDMHLRDVLGAIKAAPKDDGGKARKTKKAKKKGK